MSDEECGKESEALPAKLQTQQRLFRKLCTPRAELSRQVMSYLTKSQEKVNNGEFIKERLMDSAALICPEGKMEHLRVFPSHEAL